MQRDRRGHAQCNMIFEDLKVDFKPELCLNLSVSENTKQIEVPLSVCSHSFSGETLALM